MVQSLFLCCALPFMLCPTSAWPHTELFWHSAMAKPYHGTRMRKLVHAKRWGNFSQSRGGGDTVQVELKGENRDLFLSGSCWTGPVVPWKLDQVEKVTSLRVCLVIRERWAPARGTGSTAAVPGAGAHLSLWCQKVLKAPALRTLGAYTAAYCSPFSLTHYSHLKKLVTPAVSQIISRKNSQFTDGKLA